MAKKSVKSKSNKNLVVFVENCTPITRNFSSANKALDFVKKFRKKYPETNDGYWVDMVITNILGKVHSFDGHEIEE